MTLIGFDKRYFTIGLATLLFGVCLAAPLGAIEFRQIGSDRQGGTDAAISPDGKFVVASSQRSGSSDLWMYEIETGVWTRLTDEEGEDTEPQWSPDGKRIAFVSERYDNKDLWILNLHDRSIRRLTRDREDEDYPAWSPDGETIVYTGGPWKSRHFYLIPARGGEPRPVNREPAHVGACSFHPQGDSLLCHTYVDGNGSIVQIGLDGRVIKNHTDDEQWDFKPSVSPDGQWLAFSRSGEAGTEVWLKPLAGDGPARPLFTGDPDNRWPMFTKDGRHLFFHRTVLNGASVMVFNRQKRSFETLVGPEENPLQASLDPQKRYVAYCAKIGGKYSVRIRDRVNGTRRTLHAGGAETCYPRWSPDGRRIAFVILQGNEWEIATARPDGSGLTVWTSGHDSLRNIDAPLDWSPDGTRIVFQSEIGPYESDIFLLDTDDGSIRNLTRDAWYDEAPSWDPDGRGVVFMSTRGGGWTWGFYRLTLADEIIESLSEADYLQKNFLRVAADGSRVWMQYDRCDAADFVMLEEPGNNGIDILRDYRGARWPSFSRDGQELIFTTIDFRIEHWLATRGPGEDWISRDM